MRKSIREKKRPSIRTLVTLKLGTALAVFILTFTIIFFSGMQGMLYNSEDEQILVKGEIVKSSLNASMASARAFSRDWASWDETYDFALGNNPDHFAKYWTEDWKIQGQQYNFLYAKDLSGVDLYCKYYDYFKNESSSPPDGFSDFLSELGLYMLQNGGKHHGEDSSGRDGVVFYGGVPYYVCARPILTYDEKSEPAGVLLLGRILGEQELKRVTGAHELSFSIIERAPFGDRENHISRTRDTITLSTPIKGFYDEAKITLEIDGSREMYKNGLNIILFWCLTLAAVILCFVFALFRLLRKYVLRHIERISGDVKSVAYTPRLIDADEYGESREFYSLAKSINEMLVSLNESRENVVRTSISIQTLENLLNSLSIYLFVSDTKTYKVLFINDKMKEHFHIRGNVIGRPCSSVVFQCGMEECEVCPKKELLKKPDEILVFETYEEASGRYFKQFNLLIDWIGSNNAHLQYFIDITEIKQAELTLKKRLEQEELMSAISSGFITDDDINAVMNNALEMTGKFMNIRRISVAQYHEADKTFELQYIWDSGVLPEGLEIGGKVIFREGTPMYKALIEDDAGYFLVNDTSKGILYNHIRRFGAKSFMAISIYVSGRFWGILECDHCSHTYEWTESDLYLCRLIGNVISGVLTRQNAERQRIEAKEEAENASRAKSEFLSRMSHEIRTPLNAVIGMTNIARASNDPDKKEYCLEKIDVSSKHLLGIINDILDMSKIEANKFELSYSEFNIEKAISGVIGMLNFRTDNKRQALTTEIAADIPKIVVGDEMRLNQVLMNILSNAVKFSPENGKINLKAKKISESGDACTLQFIISDNGIGISAEQISRLFNSFEQADKGIARKFGGTGLGLAISKRIVELMGGEIWIESELGKGSKFFFTIRVQKPGKGAASFDEAADAPVDMENSFLGHTILMAEDVEINREIITTVLAETGAVLEYALNGAEAYEMFRKNPDKYSLILMDVHMPEMDGFEATRRIRALDFKSAKEIPIIAMTANVFKEDIELCLKSGMNAHVGKPVDINELHLKLGKYLKKR